MYALLFSILILFYIHIGGEDFDNILVDFCLKNIEDKVSRNAAKAIKSNHRSAQRLRKACEAGKRTLSTVMETELEVPGKLCGGTLCMCNFT